MRNTRLPFHRSGFVTRGVALATALLLVNFSSLPAWGIGPGVVRYELTPPSGLTFVSPAYTTPVATDGRAVGWTALTNISALHPTVWTSTGTPIDMSAGSPPGLNDGAAFGVSGNFAVGAASGTATGGYSHAVRWNAGGVGLDLHPAGYQGSNSYGINGNQIVGSAHVAGGQQNAMLWNATTGSFTNLHPAGRTFSIAFATTGTQQVGYGSGSGGRNALLWSGTAASVVDLNTGNLRGVVDSIGRNAGGGQQVGDGFGPGTGGNSHALFWTGTAASMVDLHPTSGGYSSSGALGTNGIQQVGYARTGNNHHAFLWSGNSASAVNLHALLPSGFVASDAWNIDSTGNVFGIAQDTGGDYHYVSWAVPEPASLSLLAFAALGLRRGRRS